VQKSSSPGQDGWPSTTNTFANFLGSVPGLGEDAALDEGEVAIDVVAVVQAEADDVIVEHPGPSDLHESSSSSGSDLSSISSMPICRSN
jgi:hypothetical protein